MKTSDLLAKQSVELSSADVLVLDEMFSVYLSDGKLPDGLSFSKAIADLVVALDEAAKVHHGFDYHLKVAEAHAVLSQNPKAR